MPMDRERLTERRQLAESAEDPVDRADRRNRIEAERQGSCGLAPEGYDHHEMWRRILAAHIQPLAGAAD
jgi:hypothetical protein